MSRIFSHHQGESHVSSHIRRAALTLFGGGCKATLRFTDSWLIMRSVSDGLSWSLSTTDRPNAADQLSS
jgi:hypothetical protein